MYLDTSFDVETWMLASALYAAYQFQRLADGVSNAPAWDALEPMAMRAWAAVARAVEHLAGGP